MTSLEQAILKTLLYADIFHYPLTEREIQHYLIGYSASLTEVHHALTTSDWLRQCVLLVEGYYTLQAEDSALRLERAAISDPLRQLANYYGRWLAYVPFVRMVALTGALAMQNSPHPNDDFDYLIVTATGRVWLSRLMIVAVVRFCRLWGVELCPNYLLTEEKLIQPRQNLYIAHELAQMVPISGHELYAEMRRVNPWADVFLPNAQGVLYPAPPHHVRGWGRFWQASLEWALAGKAGTWLEHWEGQRKARKFASEAAQNPHSAAVIDAEQVKGHFNDYGHYILDQYRQRLQRYQLEE